MCMRYSLIVLLIHLLWCVCIESFDIYFRDLCSQDKANHDRKPHEVCYNCDCLSLTLDSLLSFNNVHARNSNYDNEMLFELTYELVLDNEFNGTCNTALRFGTKAIDFLDLYGNSSKVSRSVVFNLVGAYGARIAFDGTCHEDFTNSADWSVLSLSVRYLRQPEKYTFKLRIPEPQIDDQPSISNRIIESTVLNDYITYSSRDDSMSVSEIVEAINSPECNLLGSSDATLLNKIEVPRVDDPLVDPAPNESNVKVLCAIFTMESNHATKVKAVTETWARKCTQFLAFSTVDDDSIPSIHIPHLGAEEYRNMWEKSRAIWKYIHTHYRKDFDYFLLGGDDMYYIMENLYQYLNSEEVRSERSRGKGMYLGRVFRKSVSEIFNSGGSGYLLDGVALELLIANLDEPHCEPLLIAPHEDLRVGVCLNRSIPSLSPYGTEDPLNRQRWHAFTPGFHYTFVPSVHIPRLPTDHWYEHYDLHIRSGFDCCAVHSIAFHFVWVSLMYDMHNYLYKCPQIAKDYYYGFYGETYFSRTIKVLSKEDKKV